MTIVNLEGPLTTSEHMREEQTYCIKGDPAYAHLLTLGSIEAVSLRIIIDWTTENRAVEIQWRHWSRRALSMPMIKM